jgi:hypothetical protein
MTFPRADLDSPWKNILRDYFPQAITFFFPDTAAIIDWDRHHEFLDKEFQQISQDAALGRRYADQLVKVWRKDGEAFWLILHVEIQSQSESGFSERMLVYNLRIFDQFRQVPISLAILCDDSKSWRPSAYRAEYPDTRLIFEYGVVKLLDFRDRWDELECSDNPFATVVMAHLKMLETHSDEDLRKTWKLSLIRALYDRGLGRQDVLNLYRFIDWLMILPETLDQKFWQELKLLEEERKVAYVTTGERIGFQRGQESGRHEEGLNFVRLMLNHRFGKIAPETESKLSTLSLAQLEELGGALLDFSQPSDLENWLQQLKLSD